MPNPRIVPAAAAAIAALALASCSGGGDASPSPTDASSVPAPAGGPYQLEQLLTILPSGGADWEWGAAGATPSLVSEVPLLWEDATAFDPPECVTYLDAQGLALQSDTTTTANDRYVDIGGSETVYSGPWSVRAREFASADSAAEFFTVLADAVAQCPDGFTLTDTDGTTSGSAVTLRDIDGSDASTAVALLEDGLAFDYPDYQDLIEEYQTFLFQYGNLVIAIDFDYGYYETNVDEAVRIVGELTSELD